MTEGCLSAVKARVPWPNPLASTIGLSLNSLNLIFSVQNTSIPLDISPSALSESITSVAELFQEENAPLDEVKFWESIHQDSPALSKSFMDPALPGGLTYPSTDDTREHIKADMDPAGVSVVATLIERLLARFEFDAQTIHITINHPGNISIHISIDNVLYQTANGRTGEGSTTCGERRTLSIGGLSFSVRNLDSLTTYPSFSDTSSKRTSRPVSPSSSVDEETQDKLSQSIASFPLRDASPSSSVTSSMYQSALSLSQSFHSAQGQSDTPIDDEDLPMRDDTPAVPIEQVFVSFGTTPISLELITPPPSRPLPEDDPFMDDLSNVPGEIVLNVSCGVIACAFQPWQLNGFLRLLDSLPTSVEGNSTEASTPLPLPSYTIKAGLRGLVVLLSSNTQLLRSAHDDHLIQQEFFAKPLVPLKLLSPHSRLHLDSFSLSLTQIKQNAETFPITSFTFTLSEISVFLFTRHIFGDSDESDTHVYPFPLLLTDHLLVDQYTSMHRQPDMHGNHPTLPAFELIDWTHPKTAEFGVKVSQWKARVNKQQSQLHSHSFSHSFMPSKPSTAPAVRVEGTNGGQLSRQMELDIDVAPLHFRGDLTVLNHQDGILSFFDELLLLRQSAIERGLMNVTSHHQPQEPQQTSGPLINVSIPFVRLSLRSPSPVGRGVRSGYVIADMHGITITLGHTLRPRPRTRFLPDSPTTERNDDLAARDIVLKAALSRLVISCSPAKSHIATAFLSVGSLSDTFKSPSREQDMPALDSSTAPLKPRLSVIRPSNTIHQSKSVQALSIDLPAVHIELSKPQLDALQYWADDTSQCLERLSGKTRIDAESVDETASQDTSMVGSRFFARSKTGSSLSNSTIESGEVIVKLAITEGI